jgi:endonuclease YncB( thermonuclease family)
MQKILLTFSLILGFAFAVQSQDTTLFKPNATVMAVHDGDSYKVLMDGEKKAFWVRLWGADAPEVQSNYVAHTQVFGTEAGDSVRLLIKQKRVLVDTLYRDFYGRRVAKVKLGTTDMTTHLITKGWAWYYVSNDMTKNEKSFYLGLQKTAQANKVGLWGVDGEKIKPSVFRKQNKPKK